jgi:hypothetical protein
VASSTGDEQQTTFVSTSCLDIGSGGPDLYFDELCAATSRNSGAFHG